MTIDFTLTEEDYIRFNIYHNKNTSSNKKMALITRAGLALLVILLMAYAFFLKKDALLAIVLLLAGLFAYFLYGKLSRHFTDQAAAQAVQAMIQKGSEGEFLGERTLTFHKGSIFYESDDFEHETPCSKVYKLCKDAEHLYIYISKVSAYIVPFRAFADEADAQQFVSYVEEKCGKKAV